MLRLLFRTIGINVASIYITVEILSGVITYVGGYRTILLAALVIAGVNVFVKPLVTLLLLPVHLVTLGLFRWIANLITLYIVTWLVQDLQIHAFTFPGLNLHYLIIPPLPFSAFGAFIVATLTLTVVFHFMYWVLQD